ncbi:hypothetical protein [Nocardia asteroides]|nr:hypothetical protein [Nocardia asteroides]UGT51185.1 hypothetical protein LT345_11880 [Nocardia asteroides]
MDNVMARRRTERWWAGLVVCAALLAGGCAAGTAGLPSGTQASSDEGRDQLLLTSSELPAGSSPVEVSEDRIADGFATAAGIADWSTTAGPLTVTPAECGSAQKDLANQLQQLTGNASFAGAQTVDGIVFTEVISGSALDLASISDILARCGQMTVSASVLGKQVSSTSVDISTLSTPGDLNMLGAIAFHTVVRSDVVGQQAMATSSYTGCAVIGGMTIVVRAENLAGGGEGAFEDVFNSAVEKVRAATQ